MRVSTTTATPAAFTNLIMSEPSVPSTWQSATLPLSSFAGSNIYVAFHNISVDEFILKVDDVRIGVQPAHDISITGSEAATMVEPPASWTPGCDIVNNGTSTESFDVDCEIMDGTTSLYTETVSVSSLTSGASRNVSFPAYSGFVSNKSYSVTYSAPLTGDANPSDNTLNQTVSTYGPRTVLIQLFTSIGCGYCPRAAEGLHSLAGTVGDGAVFTAYHSTTSFGADPFYFSELVSIASSYGASGYPDVYFAGLSHLSGGYAAPDYGYTNYLAEYNSARAVQTPYQVSVHIDAVTASSCDFTATAMRTGDLPSGATPKIRYAVVETDIPYSWGSSPPQTLIRNCVRDLIAGSAGVTLTGAASESDARHVDFDPSWNTANTYIVAYVQNDATGEVWNSDKASAMVLGTEEFDRVPQKYTINVHPNPFNTTVRIVLSCHSRENRAIRLIENSVEIFDLSGRLVENIQTTASSFAWTPEKSVDSGIYFIRAKTNSGEITKTLLYLK